ncbi:HutD/Ves family protein [Ralstonia pseudosolanacearum]|uniref:HutD/Ves family protein n=2 Tax=Ralstonia pseudosolanacearum TaxID=1310165 RepID=UPI003CE7313A
MKLLLPETMRRMPWKNGGGITTEIAIAPPGATLDAFDWRISTARVEAAGPFSRFAGIDRSLSVIAGGCLTLHRADGETVTLAPGGAPVRFAGETAIHVTLDAPLSDFNVMTRRGAWAHRAETLAMAAGERRVLSPVRQGMQWMVYCARGGLSVGGPDACAMPVPVPQGAALWLDAPGGGEALIAQADAAGYLVALWPVA